MTDRDFAWARIDIPGDVDLWAVSIHIKASSASTDIQKRSDEATLLKTYISANVPAAAYLVVAGDFNTYSNYLSSEPCLGYFDDFVVLPASWPAGADGNTNTNSGRSSPYDRVLVDSDLEALKAPTLIGARSFPNGFVADTRVYTPIADLAPALATDSGATGMQHMAVVRDFLVPVGQ